mgnify:FL=1
MIIKLLSSIIFLSCISLFVSLGFWQLERANEKEHIVNLYNERQLLKADKIFIIAKGDIKEKYYRNYKIKGRYINKNFLIDNKIKNKIPGFNVITPFQIESSKELVLVDRGWIPLEGKRENIVKNYEYLNHEKIDTLVQEINGYIYPREKSYTIGKIATNTTWPILIQAIDFDEIKNFINEENLLISDVVFRLSANNNFGFKREWEIISMDSNKHMGYAFQWFSMAIALFILVLIFIMRKKK